MANRYPLILNAAAGQLQELPTGDSLDLGGESILGVGNLTVGGDFTVSGTTTNINTINLLVEDKNIVIGDVASPTNTTADGGGITLKGAADKTINWVNATNAWTFSEHISIASAKEYRIAGTKVLDATSLGSGVVGSSLTSVGTIASGTWQGGAIADTYLGTIATALKVSNSATTATSANTALAIVARDGSNNFTAGTITAALTGAASSNVLKAGDTMTGALVVPLGAFGTPSLTFTGDLNTGIFSPGADQVAVATNGVARLSIAANVTNLYGSTNVRTADNISDLINITNTGLVGINAAVNESRTVELKQLSGHVAGLRILNTGSGAFSQFFSGVSNFRIGSPAGADALVVNDGGPNEYMRITGAGRVGIGASDPQRPLDVVSNASSETVTFRGASVNNISTLRFNSYNASTIYASIQSRPAYFQISTAASVPLLLAPGAGTGVGIGSTDMPSDTNLTVLGNFQSGFYRNITSGNRGYNVNIGAKTSGGFADGGRITGVVESGDSTGYLSFGTRTGGVITEKAQIDSSGRLLVGTISDSQVSTVVLQGSTSGATNNSVLRLCRGESTPANGAALGFIAFGDSGHTTAASVQAARDGGTWTSGTSQPSALTFSTAADGAASPTERMRITSGGAVRIGSAISITPYDSLSSGTLSFEGSAGQLFSITNNLTTGSIFSVNDVSGIPSIDVNASGTISLGAYGGNVGIGTLTPSSKLHVIGNLEVASANTDVFKIHRTGMNTSGLSSSIVFQVTQTNAQSATLASITAEFISNWGGALIFSTKPSNSTPNNTVTERMRITSGGHILVNCTQLPSASVEGFVLTGTSSGNFSSSGASSSAYNHLLFLNSNGIVGSISTNASATAYTTSSDYRLKENVESITDGITRIQQLKPSRFNFIVDPDRTVDGFIAHEAQAVVPEAITGEKDAVDEDGNPVYQGIDQSKLVPLLTAALQEAIAKIESLEARITSLESI